jgi:predicted ATPase/class 3 adenylate cyclase
MTANLKVASPVPAAAGPGPTVDRAFLFTDIEGSSKLMERAEADLKKALAMHDALLREVFLGAGGEELAEAGDGFLFAFADPSAALAAAIQVQERLGQLDWPEATGALAVRVTLGWGAVSPLAHGEYRGLVLNRTARLLGAAHGGQILCGKAFAAVAGGGAELRELGWFHLRDLSEPEQIFQVFWPRMLRSDFPPLRTPPVVPCNLPRTFNAFFGRPGEIAKLRELLLPHQKGTPGAQISRLVTLTGPGGTGKTRLSIQTAETLRKAYSEAVWFIPLADLMEPGLMPVVFRDALKLPADSPEESTALVLGFLKARPGLLVLDNFEQLLPAGADFVLQLLEAAPDLRLLVSSRCRLGVPGEREFPVSELPFPLEGATEEDVRASAAAQLFEDRARAVLPDFELNGANAESIAAVCRTLEGVPLAIELAASRADVVSPQAMVIELRQRLDFCRRTDTNLPPRHRSLRAAIDWSYEFLPAALREFFENLAVFRGGFTGDAASAVAQSSALAATAGDPRRALSELRSASLVRVDMLQGEIRFGLLETIREYAAEKLALRADARMIRLLHARLFVDLARKVEKHTYAPDEPEWMARLDIETENLRAAMSSDADPGTLADLVTSLPHNWTAGGRSEDYVRWVETCLQHEDVLPEKQKAYLNSAAGHAYSASRQYARAREHYQKAMPFYRATQDATNIAGTLCNLASLDFAEGNLADAEARTEEAVRVYEILGERSKAAHALANLGFILCATDQFDRARSTYERSEALCVEGAGLGTQSMIRCGLAEIAFASGDLPTACAHATDGLALAESVRDIEGLCEAAVLLTCIAFKSGRPREAARWLGAVDALPSGMDGFLSKRLREAVDSLRQTLKAEMPKSLLAEETAAGSRLARKWIGKKLT